MHFSFPSRSQWPRQRASVKDGDIIEGTIATEARWPPRAVTAMKEMVSRCPALVADGTVGGETTTITTADPHRQEGEGEDMEEEGEEGEGGEDDLKEVRQIKILEMFRFLPLIFDPRRVGVYVFTEG